MRFQVNGRLKEADIQEFERNIGFPLPYDYCSFLQQTNGGAFVGGYPTVAAETIGSVCCDSFFGKNMSDALDLTFWFQEMRGEIPANSLLIGKDPSGGFVLLVCNKDSTGVYYYDHGYNFPESSDEENTYLITESFGELARRIGIEIN